MWIKDFEKPQLLKEAIELGQFPIWCSFATSTQFN